MGYVRVSVTKQVLSVYSTFTGQNYLQGQAAPNISVLSMIFNGFQ